MNRFFASQLTHAQAPEWAESRAPGLNKFPDTPSLVVMRIPDEECWIVASRAESDIIADPDSLLGHILRHHAGLLPLVHLSNN